MDFAVEVVPDGALPQGIKQVMVERTCDVPLLILAESVAGVWSFVSDWVDEVEAGVPVACVPARLRAV